jgi:hypothetical protein
MLVIATSVMTRVTQRFLLHSQFVEAFSLSARGRRDKTERDVAEAVPSAAARGDTAIFRCS